MTKNNDATRALDRMSQGIIALVKQKVPCQETYDYELIRTTLLKSSNVNVLVECLEEAIKQLNECALAEHGEQYNNPKFNDALAKFHNAEKKI